MPRPAIHERTLYTPQFKTETFIVPLLKKALDQLIDALSPAPGARALDVGCGGQPFRPILEKTGFRYLSLNAHASPGTSIDFLCPIDGPLPPALLSAGPFDFILCTEVLEHVADWPAAFANLASLLAPNGKLLITAPHFYYLHEEPCDFFRPTTHALAHFAHRHGLVIRDLRQLGDAWDILGTLLAGCRFKALDRSWTSRSLAWTLWKLRDWAFRRIAKGRIRKRIAFTGPTYISNLILLERPPAAAPAPGVHASA